MKLAFLVEVIDTLMGNKGWGWKCCGTKIYILFAEVTAFVFSMYSRRPLSPSLCPGACPNLLHP
jgi:hypothetical protein